MYFLLVLFGGYFVANVAIPSDPTTRVLIQAWAYSVIGLPVYWGIKAIVRAYRGK
jgi:hypothetical protein